MDIDNLDINNLSVGKFDIDYETTRCNRAKLDTGFHCNYHCEFCYYIDQLDVKTSFDVIKERIDILHKYGIDEVDLSGGESSIHKDWFKILDYCNDKFKNISCLSNGSLFANEKFLLKSKEHGLKEILFSLHGYNEEVHDDIVGRKNGWKKINKAIELCQKHGIRVRINCTVYQKNYKGLISYADVIKRIQPLEVNFIAIKYNLDNREFRNVPYRKLTDAIKDTIDCIEKDVKYINVRFTPYCYMKGYEKYVCNVYQHVYDLYDWNRAVYNQRVDTSKSYTEVEKLKQSYESAANDRMLNYYKDDNCRDCMHYYICDGIDKSLEETELYPIYGDKLLEVNHYRKGFYD